MEFPQGHDEPMRKDRKVRLKIKLDQLIDRLGMTIKDIERHPLLSAKQKKQLRKHMSDRINKL